MKKFILILAFILLTVFTFYFLNFDFKGYFNETFRSFCNKNFGEKNEIPASWLARYNIELKDAAEIELDIDNDGLSLLAEYQNSTNPLNPDTDGDGYSDGKEVRDGYNPLGEGRLDQDQDDLPDFWEIAVGLSVNENNRDQDPDGDGLSNFLEFAHLTNPFEKDSDQDGFNDAEEISNGYDPTIPGDVRPNFSLLIKKINIEAPIVWSKSLLEKDLLKDLENGVVRLPETGIPAQSGNTVISGHSSNYVWAKGEYNHIFKDLNNLAFGDEIILKVTEGSGRTFEHSFTVTAKEVVASDDSMIFKDTSSPTITLVTCWPLNTTWKRLVLKAELAITKLGE